MKGTLSFGGDSLTITGTDKAVSLTAAAEPSSRTLFGSAAVDGNTAEEAAFADGTYTVGGAAARKLSDKQAGCSAPVPPAMLTLTPEDVSILAGKTAVFRAEYSGTDTLTAYIQKNGLDENFTVTTADNHDGTWSVTVATSMETPAARNAAGEEVGYKLIVRETNNADLSAIAIIHITELPRVAEVNGTQYASLKNAFAAALDLNGNALTGSLKITDGGLLTLTGSGRVSSVQLGGMDCAVGGRLDVQSDGAVVATLSVVTAPSPKMALRHGIFETIQLYGSREITAADLLADGAAYASTLDGVVLNGYVTVLTNIKVVPHSHSMDENGTCPCGFVCDHEGLVGEDGVSVGSVKSYTFENVQSEHTIEVTFAKTGGRSPRTGDSGSAAAWLALLFAGAFGLAGTALYGRKRRGEHPV